jgi:type III pantothenate kinase
MYILGDIGNTDTKLCLVSAKNKIIKKITFPSKNLNNEKLTKYFISSLTIKKLVKFYFAVLFLNPLI